MINMARESKIQRASRMANLCAMYDAQSRALRKLTKEVDEMKAKLEAEPTGTFGEWTYSLGTPREILDQPAAKDALTKAGVPIPTKMTKAPIVITNTAATK